MLSKEGSELLAQFSLPEEQAKKVSVGQSVTVQQGSLRTEAAVRTVGAVDADETCKVTAVLPKSAGGLRSGSAQVELIFSRTMYSACLPVSAVRQDTQGSYVLVVEESQSAFGITYTAIRVPVTVLEVDTAGQYAAVEGSIGGKVIASSTRALSPGASVRIEE